MKFSISKKIINNWHAALPYLLSNGEYVLEVLFLTKQCSLVLCEILNCMFNNAVGTRVKVDPLGILDKVKVIQIYICFWLLSARVSFGVLHEVLIEDFLQYCPRVIFSSSS